MPDRLYNVSKTIVKYGIYLILATPLLVSKQLFYPFISTKIFIFRAIVEIVFIFWIILLLKDKSYRPRINHFIYLVAGFLLYLFISAIFGINFYHSFWGTIQRGGGLFVLLHVFIFFLIIISFIKSKKDWSNYLLFFVLASVLVALYALLQRFGASYVYESGATRATGTIGNAATLAGYLIFPLFFLLILFFKESNRYKRALYSCIFLLEFIVVAFSQTRGAMLAIVAGLGLWFVIGIFIVEKKKTKFILISLLAIAAISLALLFSFRQSHFVKDNEILKRFTSISINDTTAQTRLFAWRGGWEAFKDKPFFGWGLENFSSAYNKYFDANFYNYAQGETWFDYAHNIVVELLTTTGVIGLLFYFFIALIIGKCLWDIFKTSDKVLASGLFIMLLAYLSQNLLIFDSINTYLCLAFIVGYIFYLKFIPGDSAEPAAKISSLNNQQIIIVLLVCLVSPYFIYNYNIKTAQGAHYVRQAFNENNQSEKNYTKLIDYTEKSLAVRNFWGNEYISEYANLFRDLIRAGVPVDQKQKLSSLLKYLSEEGEYYYKIYHDDDMLVSRLAVIYQLRYEVNKDDKSVLDRGQILAEEAIALSPERIPTYYTYAQFYEFRGEYDKALEIINQAIGLNPNIPDSYWSRAMIYSDMGGHAADVINDVKQAVAKNMNFRFVYDIRQILPIFEANKDYNSLVKLYDKLVTLEPYNIQNYASLASAYAQAGDYTRARETALKIIGMDSSYASQVEAFLKTLPQ